MPAAGPARREPRQAPPQGQRQAQRGEAQRPPPRQAPRQAEQLPQRQPQRSAADDAARHSVVPDAAGRSLWLAAIWTGVGAAVVCALVSVVAVAVLWLPAAGTSGNTGSAIRAGLLTFLASLHGGITVDGVHAAWLPLGMLVAVGVTTWRAGSGLADAAEVIDERDPARLGYAGLAQAASFTVTCLLAAALAPLGTSSAPLPAVGVAAFVLFALTGGSALVRSSPLRGELVARLPAATARITRAAAAAVAGYLFAGVVLVAASLVVHRDAVVALADRVADGWAGVPVLLLGVLAAPNAVIAGSAYLAGPGFAVGSGTSVSALSTAHGTLPAFPLLGAVPSGPGASWPVWALAVATPLLAGALVARVAARAGRWQERLRDAALAAATAAVAMAGLAWQGGGAVADGRLHTVGASAWQLGLAVFGEVAVVSLAGLGMLAALRWIRSPIDERDEVGFLLARPTLSVVDDDAPSAADTRSPDELAG